MIETKDQLRREILAKRESMNKVEALKRSASILRLVMGLSEYRRAKVVHTYVSSKPNEVDTRRLIDRCFKEGKRVVVPVVDSRKRSLKHSEIRNSNELQPATFGIHEPIHLREVDISEIDLVIVPALVLDSHGNRIGFGGGYYDRFLKEISCKKIALAYDFQVLESIAPSKDDVGVDVIVTETRVIRCN